MVNTTDNKNKYLIVCIHAAAWILTLALPSIMLKNLYEEGFHVNIFDFYYLPIVFIVAFYLNYLFFIPKFLFTGKLKKFILIDILLLVSLTFSVREVHELFRRPFQNQAMIVPDAKIDKSKGSPYVENDLHPHHRPDHKGWCMPMLHDSLSISLVLIISILVRFTVKWFSSKEERQVLEKTKYEMELKNLKSQLNPHFLFNTLNNIYALIGISQDNAQQAVSDLSKLLRYVLYDSGTTFVPLSKEVEFINNYIKLMQLRLSDSVKLSFDLNISGYSDIPVVQLVFISLVENAFKHGVNATLPSFIDIHLSVNENKSIIFEISNSFFPKTNCDKSGSGIGLDNLKRRLDLLYPDNYYLSTKVVDNCYVAKLILNTKHL